MKSNNKFYYMLLYNVQFFDATWEILSALCEALFTPILWLSIYAQVSVEKCNFNDKIIYCVS